MRSGLQASHRCMLEMNSVHATHVQAELHHHHGLCDSGPVSMQDDDWACLSTFETDGKSYRTHGPHWPDTLVRGDFSSYELVCRANARLQGLGKGVASQVGFLHEGL